MYLVQKFGDGFIIVKDGQSTEDFFNYYCEAQERADELNAE